MGLTRQQRIVTLLVIDTAFFFLELIVGSIVGSLALVADSFHMLNDVLSLVVALYTIKLATSPSSNQNSYGWQRAEILGALINGVFLIALCLSIFLEAIQRLVSPPEVSNPKLIVIVGSMGLLSNIVGLVLFHEHGHSHGGGGGGHSHDAPMKTGPISLPVTPEESGAEPTTIPRPRADSMSSLYQHPAETRAQIIEAARLGTSVDDAGFLSSSLPGSQRQSSVSRRAKHPSLSRHRASLIKAPVPGSNETIRPSSSAATDSQPASPTVPTITIGGSGPTYAAVAASNAGASSDGNQDPEHGHPDDHAHDHDEAERGGSDHSGHSHGAKENGVGGHDHGHGGHGHGSMNMHGVFLHVLGDALGNIGVIAAGLVIWFCKGKWTLYFDPGVSLFITCIIFSSALPLVKSASVILMQGVPNHVSLDNLRNAIREVPGVVSVHDLHVWQLSETASVASVHILILPGYDYMDVANDIRQVMHAHGIHSVTVQPEFSTESAAASDDEGGDSGELSCLIRCPPDQCAASTCCPPAPAAAAESTSTPDGGELPGVAEGDERSNHSGHSH